MLGFLYKIRDFFYKDVTCGMCGRVHIKYDEIEYLAKNDEGEQQIYKMNICNECYHTLDYLKDRKWQKTQKS